MSHNCIDRVTSAVTGEADHVLPLPEGNHEGDTARKLACSNARKPATPRAWVPRDSKRTPLAAVLAGAPRGLCCRGMIPDNLDGAELERLARRWSR